MNIFTRILIYYITYPVGLLLMLIWSLIRCGIYKSSRRRALFYSFYTFLSGLAGAMTIGIIYNFLFSLKDIEVEIYVDMLGAVIFTSLFLLAAVYIEKFYLKRKKSAKAVGSSCDLPVREISFRDTMDMMIPGSFIVFGCIKLGCYIRGCCYGVENSWGITYADGITRFPVQIFECASIFLILIICFFIKQTSFFRRGMAGPLTAFMYGWVRFFWEFKRYNTPEMQNFLFGLTLWQLFSILVIIVSGVWLAVLYKTQPSEPLPEGRLQMSVEKLLFGKRVKKKTGAKAGRGSVKTSSKKRGKKASKKRR